MSKPYQIRYLGTAEADLIDIFEYIHNDKPSAAGKLLERFDERISQLSTNPYLGIIPKDNRLKQLGYRILIIDKYLVFYVVKTKTVQIRRVIHGSRQYQTIL